MNREFITKNTVETEEVGRTLCRSLLDRNVTRAVVSLDGDMGVGKTAFTRGFCSALGIMGVRSPTYTVVNEYKGDPLPVFHFDLYRIADEDDLYSVGFDEYPERDGFCLIEWAMRVPDALPKDRIRVVIERTDANDGRRITISEDEK